MNKFFTLLSLTISLASFGQSSLDTLSYPIDIRCEQCLDSATTTTTEMMTCFSVARDAWEQEVTKYYNLLMTKLKPEQKEKLIFAQKDWITFKEKEFELCNSIYYDEEQGREKRIDAISRQAQIIKQRAIDLMQYYDLFLE